MKSGDDIKAKVLEVTQTEIKYKKFESMEGATYTINKSEVLMIRYQDGTKDVFNGNETTKKRIKNKARKTTGYISINGGVGIPIGSFASATSSNSGYALSGDNYNIDFGIPIAHSHFGIAANATYYSNPVDVSALESSISSQYPYYNGVNISNGNYTSSGGYSTSVIQSGNYSSGVLMGGLYITYPFRKLSFDLKLLAGIAISSTPSYNITNTEVFNVVTYTPTFQTSIANANSETATSFAYGINFTARYVLKKFKSRNKDAHSFLALINITYFSTNPSFTGSIDGVNTTNVIPLSILGISAGLGYSL